MKRKAAITLLSMLLMAALWMAALCGCGSKSASNTIDPWDTPDQQTKGAVEILSTGGFSAFAGFEEISFDLTVPGFRPRCAADLQARENAPKNKVHIG